MRKDFIDKDGHMTINWFIFACGYVFGSIISATSAIIIMMFLYRL